MTRSEQSKILVTGANGFIGQAVVSALQTENYKVFAAMRRKASVNQSLQSVSTIVSELDPNTNWIPYLSGMEAIIHCAARAHVMDEANSEPLKVYRHINTESTLNLAKQAAKAGIKRFVFISSIKVNGEKTIPGKPFREEIDSVPTDPYAISKWEAEQGLMQISEEMGMDVVIIRPPLVYGPGVKGNFATILKWLKKGVPLPLGAIHNQRSLLALDNLVDFILLCLKHPKAVNQTFVLADGEDVSTTQLFKKIANTMNRQAILIPVPANCLSLLAMLLRKKPAADRLLDSLQIDISKAQQILGWRSIISMDEELEKMINTSDKAL